MVGIAVNKVWTPVHEDMEVTNAVRCNGCRIFVSYVTSGEGRHRSSIGYVTEAIGDKISVCYLGGPKGITVYGIYVNGREGGFRVCLAPSLSDIQLKEITHAAFSLSLHGFVCLSQMSSSYGFRSINSNVQG